MDEFRAKKNAKINLMFLWRDPIATVAPLRGPARFHQMPA